MFACITIGFLSVVMLVYWLRYTCLLLLQARRAHDFALPVIREHSLTFRSVAEGRDHAAIERQLQRDFEVLSGLVSTISAKYGFEVWVLRVDYALMSVWWRMTRTRYPQLGSSALAEMSGVLENWATLIGLDRATGPC